MNLAEFSKLPDLSDGEFLAERQNLRPYTACILKRGPNFEPPGPDHTVGVTKVLWEHGKRNTALHRAGLLPIVCPISDDGTIAGLGVFNATVDEARQIMSGDPAVKAQVLTYEVHATQSFVGSTLPNVEAGTRRASG